MPCCYAPSAITSGMHRRYEKCRDRLLVAALWLSPDNAHRSDDSHQRWPRNRPCTARDHGCSWLLVWRLGEPRVPRAGGKILGSWRFATSKDSWKDNWDIAWSAGQPPETLVKRFDDATAFCVQP